MIPQPDRRRFRPGRNPRFEFNTPFGFFPRHHGFGFDGCGFGFPRRTFFFGGDFDCFNGGFFFDPFFFGAFSSSLFYGPAYYDPSWYGGFGDPGAMNGTADPASPNSYLGVDPYANSDKAYYGPESSSPSAEPKDEPPVVLLQLRNGLMYGLKDYWFENGELHYTTTYGGQNSLPLEQIDLAKTTKLNADRGITFALHPKLPN